MERVRREVRERVGRGAPRPREQAERDAGHVALDRHAGVHERQAARAHGGHAAAPVRLEHLAKGAHL